MDGQSRSKNISFSFSGCGFLGIYHIGVASCLQRYVPQIVKEANFAGASAGAMIACCVICDVPLDQCVDFTLRLAHKARMSALGAFNPTLDVNEILRSALDEVLPPDAHVRCTNRLFVSITELPLLKNHIISKFHSREHLIHVLLMSAFVPGFSGYFNLPYENGKICVDGGFSVNIPILNNKTIVVSPFSGESDICPSDFDVANIVTIDLACTSMKVSVANFCRVFDALFPPPSEQLKEMCWQGYTDCMQYLTDHKMIGCPEHMMYINLMHNAQHHHGSCEQCQQTVESSALDTYLPKAILQILDIYHWKESRIAYRIFTSCAYKAIVILTKPWLFCVNGWFRFAYMTMTMVPFMPKSVLERVGDMTRNLTAEAVLLMMEKAVKFLMRASLYRATLAVHLTVEHCEDEKILAQDVAILHKDEDRQQELDRDRHRPLTLPVDSAVAPAGMEPCQMLAATPGGPTAALQTSADNSASEHACEHVHLPVPPVVIGDIDVNGTRCATPISMLRCEEDIHFGLTVNFKTHEQSPVESRNGVSELSCAVKAVEDVCVESLVLEPPEAASDNLIVENVDLLSPASLTDSDRKKGLEVTELCPESLDTMQACVEAFQEMELIMILHYLDKDHKMHAEAIYGPARYHTPSSLPIPAAQSASPSEEVHHLDSARNQNPISEENETEPQAVSQEQETAASEMPHTPAVQSEVVKQELEEIIVDLVQKERQNEQQWCKMPHMEHSKSHSSFSLKIRGWLGGQQVSSSAHSPHSSGVSPAEGLLGTRSVQSGGSHMLRSVSDAAALARKLDALKSGRKLQHRLSSIGKSYSTRLYGRVSGSISDWDLSCQGHPHSVGTSLAHQNLSRSLQSLENVEDTNHQAEGVKSSSSSTIGADAKNVKMAEKLVSTVGSSIATAASTVLATSLEKHSVCTAEASLHSSMSSLETQRVKASLGDERICPTFPPSRSPVTEERAICVSSFGKSYDVQPRMHLPLATTSRKDAKDGQHATVVASPVGLTEDTRGEEVFSRRKASRVEIGGKVSLALLQKESKGGELLRSSCSKAVDVSPKLTRSRSLHKSPSDIKNLQQALMELMKNDDEDGASFNKSICIDSTDASPPSAAKNKSSNGSKEAKKSSSYRDCVLS